MNLNKHPLILMVLVILCFSAPAVSVNGQSLTVPAITLEGQNTQPFQSLFSNRTTLDGSELSSEYELGGACAVVEGVSTYHFIDHDFIPSNQITALCEDKNGNIFIGTKDAGVIKLSVVTAGRAVFNKFPIENPKKHGQIAIHDMAYNNREKRIYVATTGGLFNIVDDENFSNAACRAVEVFGDRTITALAFSRGGDLWAGTSEGLFDKKGVKYGESDGLPGERIRSLLFDSNDNLWVGTENGLAVRRSDTFRSIDFGDDEKYWINDLILTKPLELMIPIEKYELIVNAFFAGIKINKAIEETSPGDLDARMQAMLDVAKPGSATVMIATSNGMFQIAMNDHKAQRIENGWMHCASFKDSGLMYSYNNSAELINLSPTTRDLARFDIGRRFRGRMLGRMFREVRREAAAQLLDEKTIDSLHGRPEETILPELEARLQSLRATSMLIDSNNLFWLALDGAGLFMADAKMNTGDFFVSPLGRYTEKDADTLSDQSKYRYYLTSLFASPSFDSDDMLQGRALYDAAYYKTFEFAPLKTWFNKCSHLGDDDWNRVASYVGRTLQLKPIFEFIAILGSDPVIFIPGIGKGDIPDLDRATGEGDLVAESEEFIKAHETYQLPLISPDPPYNEETYPANHPDSRLNARELPVESTFD